MSVHEHSGLVLFRRLENVLGEGETVFLDFVGPPLFEAVGADHDHPVGVAEVLVPRELSQCAEGLAEPLLEEPTDAPLVAGEVEGSDLNRVERAHFFLPCQTASHAVSISLPNGVRNQAPCPRWLLGLTRLSISPLAS